MSIAALRDELVAALQAPNLRAFLVVVRTGEGTADDDGYRRLFGGELAAALSDHPRRAITRELGGRPVTSTAAGAYQFLARTWDECRAALSLPDFRPSSQDLAAAYLIRRRGALADVLAGRISAAIDRCCREWASLPGSPYGQPTLTLARALAVYVAAGGALEGMPPAPGPPPPATAPAAAAAAPTPEATTTMLPIIAALLPTLAEHLPELARAGVAAASADPAKAKVAEAAARIVTDAVGARNLQEAAEMVAADPAAAQAARAALRQQWYQIGGTSEEALASARALMAQREQPGAPLRTVVAGLTFHEVLSLYLVTICAAGAAWVLAWSDLAGELKSGIVTLMIVAGFSGVREFWFGSSHGSKTKDDRGGV